MVFRIPRQSGQEVLTRLWSREMITAVYDPKWLTCHTSHGPVQALAFTLSRKSPSHTGVLSEDEYRRIFSEATGDLWHDAGLRAPDLGSIASPQHPRSRPGRLLKLLQR
jgi:cation transport protein ChaC